MAQILVADTNCDVRMLLQEKLAAAGHVVTSAASLEEGMSALAKSSFDVAVLELDLADASGQLLLRHVRTQSECPKIPVIALTGTARRDLMTQAWELEAAVVLAKPFSLGLLMRKLAAMLTPPPQNASLDPASVRILLTAASYIFSRAAGLTIEPGRPFLKTERRGIYEYSAIIRFRHRTFDGFMAMNLDGEFLYKILAGLMGVENASRDIDVLKDCCGELTNQILGRAKHIFMTEKGIAFELGVPQILYGRDHVLHYPPQASVLVVPFLCQEHKFYVEFCTDGDVNPGAPVVESATAPLPVASDGDVIFF